MFSHDVVTRDVPGVTTPKAPSTTPKRPPSTVIKPQSSAPRNRQTQARKSVVKPMKPAGVIKGATQPRVPKAPTAPHPPTVPGARPTLPPKAPTPHTPKPPTQHAPGAHRKEARSAFSLGGATRGVERARGGFEKVARLGEEAGERE
jgi:hypothetical protein